MRESVQNLVVGSLVPRRSLLIRCPREVYERAGERARRVSLGDVTAHGIVQEWPSRKRLGTRLSRWYVIHSAAQSIAHLPSEFFSRVRQRCFRVRSTSTPLVSTRAHFWHISIVKWIKSSLNFTPTIIIVECIISNEIGRYVHVWNL